MNRVAFVRYLLDHPFPRFCVVGGTGFMIDAMLLKLLHEVAGIELLPARCLSIMLALTATWQLNRRITFQAAASQNLVMEWTRYVLANGVGAALNVGIFMWLMQASLGYLSRLMPALAIASIAAMWFNYLAMRLVVFTGQQRQTGAP